MIQPGNRFTGSVLVKHMMQEQNVVMTLPNQLSLKLDKTTILNNTYHNV